MLLVENVSKRYAVEAGVVEALHDVDAEIPRAAVTALVGVSGSGKSTLLRLLAGLEAPTRGRVVADGVDLTAAGAAVIRGFRRTEVSFVSQRAADNLFPHLTRRRAPSGATRAGGSSGSGSRTAGRLAPRSSRAASSRARHSPSRSPATRRSWSSTSRRPSSTTRAHGRCSTHSRTQRASARPSWSPRTTLTCSRSPITWSSSRGAETPAPPLILRRLRRRPAERIALRAEHLSRSYGQTVALDDVSLELHAGELGVAVGRSGSGKSTLLMLLGGWQRPDRGRIDLPAGRAWAALGYVPQRFGLVPELTVAENVGLPGRLVGREVDVHDLLERLGLDGLGQRAVDRALDRAAAARRRRPGARAAARRAARRRADVASGQRVGGTRLECARRRLPAKAPRASSRPTSRMRASVRIARGRSTTAGSCPALSS